MKLLRYNGESRSRHTSSRSSWQVKHLVGRGDGSPGAAQDKLVGHRRSEKESLGTYAADLRLYAWQGYPNFDDSKQEELALPAFVQGLQPKQHLEHIHLSVPWSLAAALAEAERAEHVLQSPGVKH